MVYLAAESRAASAGSFVCPGIQMKLTQTGTILKNYPSRFSNCFLFPFVRNSTFPSLLYQMKSCCNIPSTSITLLTARIREKKIKEKKKTIMPIQFINLFIQLGSVTVEIVFIPPGTFKSVYFRFSASTFFSYGPL